VLPLLAAEAALTVSAELNTAPPKPTRCAPATTPTWRAAPISPSIRPTGWSPAPSKPTGISPCAPLADAQIAYDKAREAPRGLTAEYKARIRQLVTDLSGIWNDTSSAARERKCIARLLLTDVTVTRTSDTITAHVRLGGGQHPP